MRRRPDLSLVLFKLLLTGLLASLLSACANTPMVNRPEIGTLQLRETLPIEPNAATVRLQYGRIVARNAVQEQDPFCVFEIDSVRPEIQTVTPGLFRIVAITRNIETIAGMPVTTAGWQIRRVGFIDDELPTFIYYKTRFSLTDAQQPVRALTCMSNQNSPGSFPFMRHLTLAEIRATLGARFTLILQPQRL